MHTISSLRKTLGLTTMNQVRNRIEAIKDLLSVDLRRGPNNQILITDHGVELLRQLQELHDSGLTMTEASTLLQAKAQPLTASSVAVSPSFLSNRTQPGETAQTVALLREEIAFLRERVIHLEDQLRQATASSTNTRTPSTWWEQLKGDLDAA